MKTNENRSAFVAHDSLEAAANNYAPSPTWASASRCNRPHVTPAPKPSLFSRLLSLLGLK